MSSQDHSRTESVPVCRSFGEDESQLEEGFDRAVEMSPWIDSLDLRHGDR